MFDHFISAQAEIFEMALAEMSAGRKRSHWMWFVFPQIDGLGHSAMAKRFALSGLVEARQYLAHPLLGARLRAATEAVLQHRGRRTAHEIFGFPDDLKFHSSMTLFHRAAPEESSFEDALAAFYGGKEDDGTLRLLEAGR